MAIMQKLGEHSGYNTPSRLMERYEKICQIGRGGYSKVYKCRVRETGTLVAIKMLNEEDDLDPRLKQLAIREIKLLNGLKHPNLIGLIEVFRRKKKLHFVFELCEQTVLKVIETNPNGVPMPLAKSITWQTLQALNYFHSHNCLHRDVKPENLLLTKDFVVKLCDFGWARKMSPGEAITDYVATRWYRAPELLVGDTHYGPKVDVWALGCVFAELVKSEPLWSGKSDLDQLYLICKNLGDLLPRHMQIFKSNVFFAGLTIPTPTAVEPLEDRFSAEFKDSPGMDFLKRCVDKDPGSRYDCEKLLAHSFFKNYNFKYPKNEENHELSVSRSGSLLPHLPSSTMASSSLRVTGGNLHPHFPSIS